MRYVSATLLIEPTVLQPDKNNVAARSVLSRVTISREMRKLKDQGLVVVEHGTIVINNLSALELAHGAEI